MNFKEIMEEFRKTGEFRPEMMNVGQTLRPQESNRYIDLLVKQSDFLAKITVERCARLTKDVNVWEFVQEVLQRVPEGTPPEKFTSISNVGKTLDLRPVQLFTNMPFSFYEDNADNPGIEGVIQSRLAGTFSRDIVRLGFLGTKDDYSNGFRTLHTGWLELMKVAANSKKINTNDYDNGQGITNWPELIAAVIRELSELYKGDSCSLIMNRSDYEQYAQQIGNMNGAFSVLFMGNTLTPHGYKIELVEHMPRGCVVFTPLRNLVFGHGRDIQRMREVRGTKRCVDYTVNSYIDYVVAVDEAAVIAWPQ